MTWPSSAKISAGKSLLLHQIERSRRKAKVWAISRCDLRRLLVPSFMLKKIYKQPGAVMLKKIYKQPDAVRRVLKDHMEMECSKAAFS